MEKKALLNVDPVTVGRYALGGLAMGGGAAALLNLIHMAHQAAQDRKRKLQPTETDENTIVLTLPKRAAAEDDKVKFVSKPTSVIVERLRTAKAGRQLRTTDGKFGTKTAGSGWPTLTASALAALGGGTAGVMLVDKLYQVRRERQLKAELEAAKQEYADLLAGNKKAESIENLFSLPSDGTKTADGDHAFGYLNYPIAAAALLTILGTGGAGYLTKKILDEKLLQQNENGFEVPKVKRIVFRTQPETDVDKRASSEDVECIKAAMVLMLDAVAGTHAYGGTPEVKTAAAAAGVKYDELVKMAQDSVDKTMTFLKQNPDVWKMLVQSYVKSPFQRFVALRTPFGRQYVDKQLRTAQAQTKLAQTAGGTSGMGGPGGGPSIKVKRTSKDTHKVVRLGPSWMAPDTAIKNAQEVTVTPIVGTSLLSSIIGASKAPTAEEIAKALAVEEAKAKEKAEMDGMKERGTVELAAADPEAQRYLDGHQKRVVDVVRRLASEGQI